MTTDPLELRDLTSADHDQAFAVRTASFGKLDASMRQWWNSLQDELIAARRAIGVFDGRRLVALAKARSFQQFWGGRPVPMSGIAGVVVLPEYRGRGVGSLMMRALAERSVELGDSVSALYPATLAPYRRAGWEIVGAQNRISIDAHLLRGLDRSGVRPRPGSRADASLVRDLLTEHYVGQNASGPKLLSTAEIEEALTDAESFSYLTDSGFVFYTWHEQDLLVTCMAASTEASARALWSVVGSGSSVAKRVHAYVSADDPIHLLLPEEVNKATRHARWMLRILDARRAVAARGFPADVSGSATFSLTDPLLPGQSGTWLLEVEGGAGLLTGATAARDPVRLGPNGWAALYAGTPVHVLRTAGLLGGGSPEGGDAFLNSAFGGPAPHLLEYF